MINKLKGGCLCGKVRFTVADDFSEFYQCHCQQCKQLTGSAFASNLFTEPTNIEWLSGGGSIQIYEHPNREFTKAFCKHCGSGVPFVNKRGKSLIVPAGSLLDKPTIKPRANIFSSEEAYWLLDGLKAKKFDQFPE